MGWRGKSNKPLDAENPAQALLSLIGGFMGDDGSSFASWEGAGSSASFWGRELWVWRHCWGGPGLSRLYWTTTVVEGSPSLLETLPILIKACGNPITAETKPSSEFSPFPCPCGCRALSFPVRLLWFWKDYRQFLWGNWWMESNLGSCHLQIFGHHV